MKSLPEGCRAILLAGSNRKLTGSTWWADVGSYGRDVKVGAGAVDAQVSYLIARNRVSKNNEATTRGWDATQL